MGGILERWEALSVGLLLGTGVFLTLRLRGVLLRRFGHVLRCTAGGILRGERAAAGEVTPFQAMATALAATVGTGNIVGVASALTLGGPGAVFWMWVSALLGMATKYVEVALAVRFRERGPAGELVGGPMYVIRSGLGRGWHWLAALFCLFGGLAAFGIGNAVQVGSIAAAVRGAAAVLRPGCAGSFGADLVLGTGLAAVVGAVLLGGAERIGAVTEKLVPLMSAGYVLACLAVIFTHLPAVPGAVSAIFRGAFTPAAVTGGAAGVGLRQCIRWGVKRGVFSNEAGLGSSPMAYAASGDGDPVRQGFLGVLEVFVDTIVLCTLSALTILVTGEETGLAYGGAGGIQLVSDALATVFGSRASALLLAAAMALFALATVLAWGLYGQRCWQFLLGPGVVRPYRLLFSLAILVGTTMEPGLAWEVSDLLNALMSLPNLLAVLLLSPEAVRLTRIHFARQTRLQRSRKKERSRSRVLKRRTTPSSCQQKPPS